MITVRQLGDCLVAVGVDRSPRHQKRFGARPIYVDPQGYARLFWRGRQRLAHRVIAEWMHEWEHGTPLPDEAVVHHECGVRSCVLPGHLRVMERGAHVRLHAEQRRRRRG